ncbi:hypothetical protein DyAD56_07830 [Dyella sp. AD56]|uniref:hypothetical protein n=1 Tax=Dyella sp. AD56 TaxID=1528744 RepID=UPI000C8369E7|nr:hypothetical protein [Dyella sp. AD56]PMQ05796.1 hypothetical protein DyAD56_07830 [Dyella sp. AD56]
MGQRIEGFGRQLAVAVTYGLLYVLLRKLGFSHFAPVAGFKLGVLLLAPKRYWPTLFVCELLLLAYGLVGCITAFGWPFYLAAIVPPILLLMPIVLLTRTYLGGLTYPRFRLSSVLTCVIACSAVLVIDGLLVESLIPNPDVVGRKPLAQLAADYFLGAYTGIVATVPLMLMAAMEWHHASSIRVLWEKNRDFLLNGAIVLLAVIAEVLGLRYVNNAMLTYAGQALLFIPTAFFSLKWGWKGAALMGTVSSFAIASLMPAKFDVSTLSSQSMMALFVTTFVVLGVQTTKLKRALSLSEDHLKKARLEQHLYEVKLQRSSFDLSVAHVELARAHRHLLLHLGNTHNRGEVDVHKDMLTRTTLRIVELANALAPPMGASHPKAFIEGPIARFLGKLSIRYQPNISGQLSVLPKNSLALLYRLACEAVAYLLKEYPSDHIILATHTESIQGTLTIRLTAISTGKAIAPPPSDLVTKSLGTHGLGLEELRTRAQLFEGDVTVEGPCVQVTLNQRSIAPG